MAVSHGEARQVLQTKQLKYTKRY